jgi:hypothetical protein
MIQARFLSVALVLALVEGVALGYAFKGQGDLGYWLMIAVIVTIVALTGAVVANAIGRSRLAPEMAARVALVVGALAGFVAAYLVQPVGGPT